MINKVNNEVRNHRKRNSEIIRVSHLGDAVFPNGWLTTSFFSCANVADAELSGRLDESMKLSGIISLFLYPFFEGGGGGRRMGLGPRELIVVRCKKT